MKKKQDWLILCVISLVAALLLAVTNDVTKDRIALQAAAAQDSARFAALRQATSFQETENDTLNALDSCYTGYAADGTVIGHVAQITVNGFGGPIEVVLGMDATGTVTGMAAGGSNFAETAGLGTRVKEEDFTNRFVGLTSTPKAGENVDTLSGATISSSAVVAGAAKCYDHMMTHMEGYVAEAEETLTAENQVTVTKHGFASDIDVTVGILPDGTIEGILVGGDNFAETAGLGELALEKDFRDQFKGKSGVLAYGDGLDAISGATITSNAVLDAVNEALNGVDASAPAAPAYLEETLTPSADNNNAVLSRKVTVQGFASEIEVTVSLDAEGKIAALGVGGPKFNETEYFGAEAQSNVFRNQFIGKSGTLSYGDGLDALSGATITSTAVLNAVNTALAGEGAASAAAQAADAPEADTLTAENQVTVTKRGFAGDIDVTVGILPDGTIEGILVGGDSFAETAGLGERAKEQEFRDQFKGKSGVLAYGDGLDAISGATITSNAVLDAVNEALNGADASAAAAPAYVEETLTPSADNNNAVLSRKVTVQGFASEIEVTVSLDAEGKIAALGVGGPKFNETEYFGAEAQSNVFRNQFIGKSGTLSYGDGLDALSGATITSTAVLNAVNTALAGE